MASITAPAPSGGAATGVGKNETHDSKNINSRATDIRLANIANAKAIAELVRTSLGPRGMDKMIQMPDGEVLVSHHPSVKFSLNLNRYSSPMTAPPLCSICKLAIPLRRCLWSSARARILLQVTVQLLSSFSPEHSLR
jgi:hypothetical protein